MSANRFGQWQLDRMARKKKIIEMIAAGHRTEKICKTFGIRPKTIYTYKSLEHIQPKERDDGPVEHSHHCVSCGRDYRCGMDCGAVGKNDPGLCDGCFDGVAKEAPRGCSLRSAAQMAQSHRGIFNARKTKAPHSSGLLQADR